ncbi:putative phosphoenolpyruvate synthase regulatory protein [Gammaproteobacteria bacterium]
MQRTIFFVSDRTGITVETLGHSLLTQFENVQFKTVNLPFVDTPGKAKQAVEQINGISRRSVDRPIVFSTLVDQSLRDIVASAEAAFFDFFGAFIGSLEQELRTTSSYAIGRSHGLVDNTTYGVRMEAVSFAMANDDGTITRSYPEADIIILGVSRSGKTPTCLYLALQFGIRAANYPLTEEDLEGVRLPAAVRPYRHKLYGLTIDPERLQKIRHQRRPDSPYSSLRQCQYETRQAEAIFRAERIAYLPTTTLSVEEIATTILANTGIERRLF